MRKCLLLFLFLLTACSRSYHITTEQSRLYTVDNNTSSDSQMISMLAPYKQSMNTTMQQVVGYADTTLYKAQPESALGNFVADALFKKASLVDPSVDAAVMNYGGLRIPYITAGDITLGKLYELMPFDNMLCIVYVPGVVLHQFCDHMAALRGWPVNNISYVIKDKKAINIMVKGTPLNEQHVYHIATNDYIATGGDDCSFLKTRPRQTTNLFIRDILIDEVNTLNDAHMPIHANIEKRVSYAE